MAEILRGAVRSPYDRIDYMMFPVASKGQLRLFLKAEFDKILKECAPDLEFVWIDQAGDEKSVED